MQAKWGPSTEIWLGTSRLSLDAWMQNFVLDVKKVTILRVELQRGKFWSCMCQ